MNLVKSVIEMLGGGITVKSEFGKGSEFIIKLPVKVLPDNECTDDRIFAEDKPSRIERINIEFSDIY